MKNNYHSKKELQDKRVIFIDSNIREKFFLELRQHLGSWKAVGTYFKIYKSRLEHLRKGTISIPYNQFIEFCKIMKETNITIYTNNILLKDKNWGRSKGGKVTYKKYTYIFEKGREKGWKNLEKKVDINIKLNTKICEFIGAFIGYGFMNKYGSKYIIQITGDNKLDREYYEKTLRPIINTISPESKPSIKKIENNTIRLTVYSKGIYKLFKERLEMKNGKKVYVVKIPDEIINSNKHECINACLRGIYDTDGCVAFDKRKSYTKPYIRIVLHMKSPELIKQVYNLLLEQKINATITQNEDIIQINGLIECKKFIDKIGFSNPRHLNKIKDLI